MLTSKEKAELKALLLQRRTELIVKARQRLNGLRNLEHEQGKVDIVKNYLSVSHAEDIVAEELVRLVCKDLSAIKAALLKLEEDTYGVCNDCGVDIPLNRLKVRPDATLCVKCQDLEDKKRDRRQRVGYFDK
jgi:DnaK suppressor protein